MESVQFIPASELNLSEDGWENISNNSNITFGDANRTLYTVARIKDRVDFDNEKDQEIFENLDPTIYIDLEN
jgi:hypothetical protein